MTAPPTTPDRILVVCTANVCRSPVAEHLLRRHLAGSARHAVVSSAGTHGGNLSIHPDTVRAAKELDLDMSGHRSRLLTRELIVADGADLVITTTREQLRAVVAADSHAWRRSFTLKELARRGLEAPRGAPTLTDWIRQVSDGRSASQLMMPDPADDLADPYGEPFEQHRSMVAAVDALTRQVASLLATAT